jgi:branched-chain amino acid transport system ATP-binding protein
MPALLELKGVEARYGAVKALHGVDIAVEEGEVVALLGPNGAGKTTTLRAISGTVRRTGEIRYSGRALGRTPEAVARQWIAHVPEGRGTFAELSVLENLKLGAYPRRDRKNVKRDLGRVYSYFPFLREREKQAAGTLSGGEQQMLALGRALMLRPALLMLDEPSLGLAPLVVRELFRIVGLLNAEEKIAVLVVEQNAVLALNAAHRAYVLEAGRVVLSGPSAELSGDESVRRSYLGY